MRGGEVDESGDRAEAGEGCHRAFISLENIEQSGG